MDESDVQSPDREETAGWARCPALPHNDSVQFKEMKLMRGPKAFLIGVSVVAIALSNAAGQQFNLSGRIVDANNNALKNISVTLSGPQAASSRTDANGNFGFSNVQGGGNYTITPADSSLIFSPGSVALNALSSSQSTVNFTGTINAFPLPSPTPSDDFSGNTLDPNRWQLGTLTQPAAAFDPNITAAQQNGQLIVTPKPSVSGLHYNGYVSSTAFDFFLGTAAVEVVQIAGGGAQTIFAIGSDSDNYFRFVAGTAANLVFEVRQNGQTRNVAIPYDPVAQRFWRFTHDSGGSTNGSIVFETAPDNLNFTQRFGATVQKPINAMQAELSGGTSTVVTNPGQAVFDNYQLGNLNDIFSTSFFVGQNFRDFINRRPDIAGFQVLTNQITSCNGSAQCLDLARQNVSASFFLSREFQETGFYVIKLQRAAFGKLSSDATKRIGFSQFVIDAQAVGAGFVDGQAGADAVLDQNQTAYAQSVAGSSAFIAKYPITLSASAYVDTLFSTAGVTPTATERQTAIAAFGAGDTAGRAAALRVAARTDTVKNAEFNSAFVLMQYFGYLRRNPTDPPDSGDAGYQFWLGKMNAFNGDYIRSEIVRSFILSTEYIDRFARSTLGTPTGSNVTAQTRKAAVTFSNVAQAGNTTFTPIDPASAGMLPDAYRLCPGCPGYDIQTVTSYSPPVTVCFAVPASVDSQTFPATKLFHGENGVLVDRTTDHRTASDGTRQICGVVQSLSPFVVAQPRIAIPSKLLNIATRLRVQSGENVLIGGFIITGTDPKRVIIRGIGPSLSQFFSGTLSDPTLELFQGNTSLASNNDWKEAQAEIEATGIPPINDKESAIVRTLAPGSYTAILRGNAGSTGIGVVEVYDLDQNSNSKLANIASRGFVDTDNNVMIGGLIVGPVGGASAKVVVRAIGPTLTNFGIAGALQDPTLDLVNSNGVVLRANDNWKDSQEAAITATGLQPGDLRESALVETLAPGNYTAIVRGKNNTTGVGLVEVYNLQ